MRKRKLSLLIISGIVLVLLLLSATGCGCGGEDEFVTKPIDGSTGSEEPASSPAEREFGEFFAPFFMTSEEWGQWIHETDPLLDLIYSISAMVAGWTLPHADITSAGSSVQEMNEAVVSTTFNFTVFPTGEVVDGRLTVAPAGAGPVPAGEFVVLAMALDDEIPMADPDRFYTYAAVFDADGDPSNNFEYMDPYDWDFYQNTDRWYELNWTPQVGQWQVVVSSWAGQMPQEVSSNARVVIDGDLVVFFIPVSEFDVSRPGYRLTAFAHDGTYAPEASGGDVIGADPTEPLHDLPQEAIVIEKVEDVSATDGG
jgi:hypothetical protein